MNIYVIQLSVVMYILEIDSVKIISHKSMGFDIGIIKRNMNNKSFVTNVAIYSWEYGNKIVLMIVWVIDYVVDIHRSLMLIVLFWILCYFEL